MTHTKNNPMRSVLIGIVLSTMILCGGCATIKHYCRVGIIEGHEALTEALEGKTDATNNAPATVACGCDLSKPAVWPLSFIGDKATVDKTLGASDGCGDSGIRDCRAMLMRPDGNSWGYKYIFDSGCLEYGADGNTVKLKCFDYKGQRYHFVGWSVGESINTMTKAQAGEWINYKSGGHGMFLFFECR